MLFCFFIYNLLFPSFLIKLAKYCVYPAAARRPHGVFQWLNTHREPGITLWPLSWKTGQSLRRDPRKKIDAAKIHKCGKSWMSSLRRKCPNHKLLLEHWRPLIMGINGTAWRVKLLVFFSQNSIYLAALDYFLRAIQANSKLMRGCWSFAGAVCPTFVGWKMLDPVGVNICIFYCATSFASEKLACVWEMFIMLHDIVL